MATYQEIKNIPNEPEKYLIDVRGKEEIAKTGTIPASINIPLPELETALNMNESDFIANFKRRKPTKDAVVIFSCLAGGRAKRATNMAQSHGFKNAKAYEGSWTEWAQKEGLPVN